MNDSMKIINEFIKKRNYLENIKIEGIIFYGSRATGYYTDNSDLDLLIIFDDLDSNYKGTTVINDIEIRFLETTISKLYKRADDDFNNQSNVLLSMVGYGIIIFDKSKKVYTLQQDIKNLYSNPLSGLDKDKALEQIPVLHSRVKALSTLHDENDPYFNHFYHLVLERIRIFYHKFYAYPEISEAKVYRIYTDTTGYRDKIFKNIPDRKFIDLYIKCLTETNLNKKYLTIRKLYTYAVRDINLNPESYYIKISTQY